MCLTVRSCLLRKRLHQQQTLLSTVPVQKLVRDISLRLMQAGSNVAQMM